MNKAAGLVEKLMRLEEQKGFGDLKSFSSFKLSDKISIHFEKNVKYPKERSKVTMLESETVGDLIHRIANEYRLAFEAVQLSRNGDTIAPMKYPSTLEQMRFYNGDTVIVTELAVAEKPLVAILDASRNFTPQALAVFKEIFADFSNAGKMSREDLARFTTHATDGTTCPIEDDRIVAVFQHYDTANKGFLNEAEFLQFYLTAARESENKT